MSPRFPFDDDEDSGTIDSFQLLHDRPEFPEGIDFETDGLSGAGDGIPLLDDVVSTPDEQRMLEGHARDSQDRETVEKLTAAVRDKLEAELAQILASAIGEALRPAMLDLETALRGEIFEALRERLPELIDKYLQRERPPRIRGHF
jgi:hypothetical protein